MADDVETFRVETDGVMLDGLLWQRWRRPTPGLLERTLDINPGLAALGPVLPRGTLVRVPRLTEPAAELAVVRLWE